MQLSMESRICQSDSNNYQHRFDQIIEENSRKEQCDFKFGTFSLNPPMIKSSKLASKENGGIGKDLSEGWAINFAYGCLHGCLFCYVDSLHRRYRGSSLGFNDYDWGQYLFIPDNIDEAIEKTNWKRWKGKEVLMSSTHDAYIPPLVIMSRKILERALPEGVKFCIQTRSPLVIDDFDLIKEYSEQVRIQVSIATFNEGLSKRIEPRVVLPQERLNIIKEAKKIGLDTGIIIAPVFPSLKIRPDITKDLDNIIKAVVKIKPDHIYCEMLHARGVNLKLIEKHLGESILRSELPYNDKRIEKAFKDLLNEYGLIGDYWPEHR